MAQRFAAEGAKVVIADLGQARPVAAAAELAAATGGQLLGIVTDVTNEDPWRKRSPKRFANTAASTFSAAISEQDVVEKVMLKDTLDKQFTSTDEIAETAVFLAEQKTLALTGQSILLTHGWFME